MDLEIQLNLARYDFGELINFVFSLHKFETKGDFIDSAYLLSCWGY